MRSCTCGRSIQASQPVAECGTRTTNVRRGVGAFEPHIVILRAYRVWSMASVVDRGGVCRLEKRSSGRITSSFSAYIVDPRTSPLTIALTYPTVNYRYRPPLPLHGSLCLRTRPTAATCITSRHRSSDTPASWRNIRCGSVTSHGGL